MKKPSRNANTINLINFDQARNCWENIVTVAELMRGCAETEWMKPEIAANASDMILREAKRLYQLLNNLEKHCVGK